MDWKRNLYIVLTAEVYKFILTEERPNIPVATAPRADLEIYKKWVKPNEMACCYILTLMSSILQH